MTNGSNGSNGSTPAATPPAKHSVEIDARDLPYTKVPQEAEFGDGRFVPAHDLERRANALLKSREHKVALSDAAQWEITYLWKAKGGTRGGALTLGKCVKVGGLLSAFIDADFVIWMAADHVREGRMGDRQVEAILFRELLHIGSDENEDGGARPVLNPHDFEDFADVVRHYGPYKMGLQQAQRAFEQLKLPMEGDGGGKSERAAKPEGRSDVVITMGPPPA